MKKIQIKLFVIIIILISYSLQCQSFNKEILNKQWNAHWISHPTTSLNDYGVFHYRKKFFLKTKHSEFIVHVSGDNRYRLFVNGIEVAKGPSRGDLANWRFETIDIAEYLRVGDNVISSVVWNFGNFKPIAQVSLKTAFILKGNGEKEDIVNTNGSWKVLKNDSYASPTSKSPISVVGPGDVVNASKYPYGWNQIEFDDNDWHVPISVGVGIPDGKFTYWNWNLVPNKISMLEYKLQRLKEVERSEELKVCSQFLEGISPITIPSNSSVKILFDQTHLTTAYPEIIVSKGKGAKIEIDYAEALVDEKGVKGNRDETLGKILPKDRTDIYYPDGNEKRHFQPLWFRTYRYIEITITTKNEPVIIEDFYGYFTAYPLKEEAYFKSNDESLQAIWDIGWRTARLCAGETYYDCPYYEQLQYVGDTRIQALISLYVSNEDKLMKNAIEQFNNSLLPMGLTQSRYPSSEPQVIPPFSLIWVYMVHDYWMHRDDVEFVEDQLLGVQNVLYWYEREIDKIGLLGGMDWWNFVDWSFGPWNNSEPKGGTPPGAIDGSSSIISLQYILALQNASELFQFFGKIELAKHYKKLSKKLSKKVYENCWSREKGLLADTPEKKSFSQHANIFAILTELFDQEKSKVIIEKILNDKSITQTTFYFKFYLVRAMVKAGRGDDYLKLLDDWQQMINLGLTTFAETPEPTRSDCHAWSAHPNYDFLATVCGIMPASPGFNSLIIEPHFGNLEFIEGKMSHPNGDIVVKFKKIDENSIEGVIIVPENLNAKFKWKKYEINLKYGENQISIK